MSTTHDTAEGIAPSALPPQRKVTCRYLRRSGDQCTAEAVDENADLLVCTKHLGQAIVLLREARAQALQERP